MEQRIIGLLLAVLLCLLVQCHSKSDDLNKSYKGNHLLYLQLDSTLIEVSEIATEIAIPWDIAIESEDWLWFTEQAGRVNRLNLQTGEKMNLLNVPDVYHKKSYGLLGMALHPDFVNNPFVFIHYTFKVIKSGYKESIKSRIVKYALKENQLVNPTIVLDSITGNTYHNGSRLLITPDDKLYFTMGDAGNTSLTQNVEALNGKIIRLNTDGSIPDDNPIPGNPVWSWGHRNPQGLTMTSDGILFSSEHGPNNDDEVNIIVKGGNYGWPNVHGFCDLENEQKYCEDSTIVEPIIAWTPTLAVSGMEFYDHMTIPEWKNTLLLTSLKSQAFRVLELSSSFNALKKENVFFQRQFGRLRDLAIGKDGTVYLATSNTDWHPRFQPWMYDSLPQGGDRIIRLRPLSVWEKQAVLENEELLIVKEDEKALDLPSEVWDFALKDSTMSLGQQLYLEQCASCHRQDGLGIDELVPPLKNVDWVTGDKGVLIRTVLNGLSEEIEVNGKKYQQEMPGFARLDDESIAAILTYIRNSFENNANPVIAGEVYEERK